MLEIPFPQGWFPPNAPSATLCYLVRQGQGWLLVDCGLKHHSCLDSLLQQLRALNISPRDIKCQSKTSAPKVRTTLEPTAHR